MDIQKIDKNFLTRMPSGIDLRFYDADEVPFEVYGLLPHQQDEPYRRIPLQVGKESNIGVEYLSASTTGGRIRFRTNSRIGGHIGRMAKPYQDEPYAVIRKQWV